LLLQRFTFSGSRLAWPTFRVRSPWFLRWARRVRLRALFNSFKDCSRARVASSQRLPGVDLSFVVLVLRASNGGTPSLAYNTHFWKISAGRTCSATCFWNRPGLPWQRHALWL